MATSPPAPAPGGPSPELLARLARLGVSVGTAGLREPGPGEPEALDAGFSSPAVLPIEEAVPGRLVENGHGRCYLSVVRRGAHEDHGGVRLAAALEACTVSLAALANDRRLAGLDVARAAFLDTETTGLGGGTGTYAFLIGVGRFVGPTFEVRQYFMRDPSEERAQLAEVTDWLADCGGLVTFNGRGFDVPLLRTRYTLHRLTTALEPQPHLDLLPMARRLWRRRLPSCALSALEQAVLGLSRVEDVPGWLIPERYFRYQDSGDARPLVGIFQHNALDILSMVSLLVRIARAYQAPEEDLRHGRDWLSLARAYEAAGEPQRARAAYQAALAHELGPVETDEAFGQLALAAKRAGSWEEAVAIWSDLIAPPAPRRLFPFEELAKYYEHRAPDRDPARALELALQARALITDGTLRPRRGRQAALAELDHRIARLHRKIGKDEG
jgi:hypothetical protein